MPHYDAIVLGTGGVGSAAAFHLARRGLKVLGLDRFEAAHDRGSSHGETRIIRKAYFEHPDYVPLLARAYELWRELETRCGRQLFFRVGLLQIGRPEGYVVRGVLESARRHRLDVERLEKAQIERRFPGFRVPEGCVGVYEPEAGYLRVEESVRAHLEQAARCGAELRHGVAVESWRTAGGSVQVITDHGDFSADRLVITAGPWAASLVGQPGGVLEVRKKPLYWFAEHAEDYRAAGGCPCFLYELPYGVFYGFPAIDEWGVKVARHSGGTVVTDPTHVDRSLDEEDYGQTRRFLQDHLPRVTPNFSHYATCMYTMSPDEHFIVDRHAEHPNVVFAAGLSGHGFKFTSVLGEVLADLAISGRTELPIGFLSLARLATTP